jgi:hypothetical protein
VRRITFPLCVGGFLEPFGGAMVAALIPSIATGSTHPSAGSLKFVGVAIAPLVYVPLFEVDTRLPFLVAAGFSALLAVSVAPWFERYR